MITVADLEKTLLELPQELVDQRERLRARMSPGSTFGIRKAAALADVSASTFCRAEQGHVKDLGILKKLLAFVERQNLKDSKNVLSWNSDETIALANMFHDGKSDRKISLSLGRSARSVEAMRYRMGLRRRTRIA